MADKTTLLKAFKNALKDSCHDAEDPFYFVVKNFESAFSYIIEHRNDKIDNDAYWTPNDFYYPFVLFRRDHAPVFPVSEKINTNLTREVRTNRSP